MTKSLYVLRTFILGNFLLSLDDIYIFQIRNC